MNLSGKVIGFIAAIIAIAIGLLIVQWRASTPKVIKLSSKDLELIVSEMLPLTQRQQLASDPEQRKLFIKHIKELLALGMVAEQENYTRQPLVQSQLELQTDLTLREAYLKRNPGAQAADEELKAYYDRNPNAFDAFLQANPQFQAQAQGPQREQMKKELASIRVLAERARREGLEKDDLTRLRLLLTRSQVLAQAYINDLQKNLDKLISDADIEQYYKDHPEEFEEVRARHILISTKPQGEESDDDEAKDKSENKPKALTEEEARRKAETILDRLRKGEDFAKLAQEFSDDPGSKSKGGDLGYFSRGKMTRAFEEAAFSLKPGQLSGVVQSDFGFHIIKVEDRHIAPLDEKTKRRVADKLKQLRLEERIEQIAASSRVEVAEDFQVDLKPVMESRNSREAWPV
jgi:peptidyl-prolyl cis-trans isomerase C